MWNIAPPGCCLAANIALLEEDPSKSVQVSLWKWDTVKWVHAREVTGFESYRAWRMFATYRPWDLGWMLETFSGPQSSLDSTPWHFSPNFPTPWLPFSPQRCFSVDASKGTPRWHGWRSTPGCVVDTTTSIPIPRAGVPQPENSSRPLARTTRVATELQTSVMRNCSRLVEKRDFWDLQRWVSGFRMFFSRSTLDAKIAISALHSSSPDPESLHSSYNSNVELRTSAVQLQSQDYLTAEEVNQSMSLCQMEHAAEGKTF